MKPIILLAFLTLSFIRLAAQNYLIVNNPEYGGYQVYFPDTLISSSNPLTGSCYFQPMNYDFDLDKDTIPDIHFSLSCTQNGYVSSANITATALGTFQMLDIPDFQYAGNTFNYETGNCDPVIFQFDLVRRFEYNDTIDLLSASTQNTLTIADAGSESYYGLCIFSNLSIVNETPCALALYKQKDNKTYIYYLLVTGSKYHLHILSVWSNDPEIDSLNELIALNPPFPNPTTGMIYLEGDFSKLQFLDMNGEILYTSQPGGINHQLDIRPFPKGMYLLKLWRGDHFTMRKVVKI
ncbi:MAG: T9SS type A sorting domain-containing protein [Bacteroidetes bacterium]|nr:T9SS type A sorting domain-containing protein [Bacteroidota bacterium]